MLTFRHCKYHGAKCYRDFTWSTYGLGEEDLVPAEVVGTEQATQHPDRHLKQVSVLINVKT